MANANTTAWPTWTAKQSEFILNRQKYPFMWGGWGAAKSWALVMRVLMMLVKTDVWGDFQGNRGMLGRWEAKALKDTTLKDLFELLPDAFIKGFNKQEMTLQLVGGSELVLPHYENFRVGGNFCFAAIDQAEELDKDTFDLLPGRTRMMRTAHGVAIPEWMRSVYGVGNPNGHSWQYKAWELNRRKGVRKDPSFDPRFHSIKCTTYDNEENLPDDYIPNLEATLTPKKLRIYVGGSWEAFEGQVYDEWDETHCVPAGNFIPDSGWKKYVGIDHGYPSAKVASFIAVDPYYRAWLYDEVVMEEAKLEDFTRAVKQRLVVHEREQSQKEGRSAKGLEKIDLWICDPSMRARSSQTDASLTYIKLYGQEALRNGFHMPMYPGENAIEAGNDKVNWLFWNCNPDRLKENLPRLYVNERCQQHRDAFESYCYDIKTGKPKSAQFDHPCDAARYVISTIFQADHWQPKKSREETFVDGVMKDMQLMKTQDDFNAFLNESGWVCPSQTHSSYV